MSFKIKKILCPVALDGESAESLKFSIMLAKDFQAELFVCFCAARVSTETPLANRNKVNNLVKKALDFYVANLDEPAIFWKSIVIENEDIAKGITDEAARRGIDLIVIGASRHSLLHAFLGSVAESVCRTAPCPVVVTHQNDFLKRNGNGRMRFGKVLAAHDFSDYSELALQAATELTTKYQAELHLLQVIAEPSSSEPEFVWSETAVASLYHRTAERLKTVVTSDFQALSKIHIAVRWGKPYREILAYSAEHEIDLIAMGAQGADFGSNTLFGSNVDRVLRQANCPVLVARPRKPSVG